MPVSRPSADAAHERPNPPSSPHPPISTFTVLSAVAGFVDAACFLALSQVFTAHVTGNFAALASALVKHDSTAWLRLTVILAFAIGTCSAVCAAHVIVCHSRIAIVRARRIVIGVEAAWLGLLLISHAVLSDDTWARYAIALFAGGAMGCQSALSKLPGALSMGAPTTVMTSNFTAWTIALVERFARKKSEPKEQTLMQLSFQLFAFIVGAAAGALGVHRFGIVVLVLPLLFLSTLALTRTTA
jgi:uncharacterized membrane protein YoaK (UPF0700 family)